MSFGVFGPGRGRLKVRHWVLTKSSPLLFHPFAASNAWVVTELKAGTTACRVSLTPVIVSVYGIELLPMPFPAAASTKRSKSASAGSPTSGWLGAFSSTVLPVKAVYTRVRLAWPLFMACSFLMRLTGYQALLPPRMERAWCQCQCQD